MEGANLKADLSEKADSNMEFKGESPINNLVSVAHKASREPGKPHSAEKAAKRKTKHNGNMTASYRKNQLMYRRCFFRDDVSAMVQKVFGYRFSDQVLSAQALTHGSYRHDMGYQYGKLVLMGKAALKLLIAAKFFVSKPDVDLPYIEAKDIDTKKLASLALEHKLHCYFRHSEPWLMDKIEDYAKMIPQYPPQYLADSAWSPPTFLSQIVLSILGAIYMDSDMSLHAVWKALRYISGQR